MGLNSWSPRQCSEVLWTATSPMYPPTLPAGVSWIARPIWTFTLMRVCSLWEYVNGSSQAWTRKQLLLKLRVRERAVRAVRGRAKRSQRHRAVPSSEAAAGRECASESQRRNETKGHLLCAYLEYDRCSSNDYTSDDLTCIICV